MFRGRLIALAALALAPGCFEQKLALEVHDDASGQVAIKQKLETRLSDLYLADACCDSEKDARARSALVDELASWEGVAAWTRAASRIEDGAIVFEATGWFDDVNGLERLGQESTTHSFAWWRTDTGSTLRWTWRRTAPPPETFAAAEKVAEGMARMRVEASAALPGPGGIFGGDQDERTTSAVLFSGADFARDVEDLRHRFEDREITEDEAVRTVKAWLAGSTLVATSRGQESAAEREAFRHKLAAAKTTYQGSDLDREVTRVRSSRAPAPRDARVTRTP